MSASDLPLARGSAGDAHTEGGITTPAAEGATPWALRLPDEAHAPRWLVVTASVGVRLLVLAVLVWLLAELAAKLTLLLVAIFVALLLAGVFAPLVGWADRKGVRRGISAGVAVAIVLALVAAAAFGIGASVQDQLPPLRDQLASASQQLSQRFGIEVPGLGTGQSSEGASGSASDSSGGSAGSTSDSSGGSSGGGVLGSVRVVFDVLIGSFLSLAFLFLFIKNGPAMWSWLVGKLAGPLREDVDAAGRAAWTTAGAYVRGLTVVALFDAVAIGGGLFLLGVPLAITLALLQFIASYIPTIGAIVAGAAAVAVAYASGGASTALFVLILVLVVQQVGNDVIEPYVMERNLPINAFAVLAAVTAGGLLWGIAGALLFVPLTAALAAAGHELWERHGRPPIAGGRAGQRHEV